MPPDYVQPGCRNCRVAMDNLICRQADESSVFCPIAKGRFLYIFKTAHVKIGEKRKYLIGSLERFAIEEGKIAKLQLERLKIVKEMATGQADKKDLKEIDQEIIGCAKLASKYGRECKALGEQRSVPDEGSDSAIFGV
jgi:hypothetical protein